MSDNRKSPRLPFELPASFELTRGEESISLATTLNISEEGLCVFCREHLRRGQQFLLQVKLPAGRKVPLQVEVRWIREQEMLVIDEYKVGLKILNLADDTTQAFVAFCKNDLGISAG